MCRAAMPRSGHWVQSFKKTMQSELNHQAMGTTALPGKGTICKTPHVHKL